VNSTNQKGVFCVFAFVSPFICFIEINKQGALKTSRQKQYSVRNVTDLIYIDVLIKHFEPKYLFSLEQKTKKGIYQLLHLTFFRRTVRPLEIYIDCQNTAVQVNMPFNQ